MNKSPYIIVYIIMCISSYHHVPPLHDDMNSLFCLLGPNLDWVPVIKAESDNSTGYPLVCSEAVASWGNAQAVMYLGL
jgi:hypothetical protein